MIVLLNIKIVKEHISIKKYLGFKLSSFNKYMIFYNDEI